MALWMPSRGVERWCNAVYSAVEITHPVSSSLLQASASLLQVAARAIVLGDDRQVGRQDEALRGGWQDLAQERKEKFVERFMRFLWV